MNRRAKAANVYPDRIEFPSMLTDVSKLTPGLIITAAGSKGAGLNPFSRVTRLAPYESFLRSAIAESESPRVSDITARGGCAMRGGSGTEAPSLAASALVTLCERARRRRRAARSAPPEPEPRFTKE
jgi:hypothetical protein